MKFGEGQLGIKMERVKREYEMGEVGRYEWEGYVYMSVIANCRYRVDFEGGGGWGADIKWGVYVGRVNGEVELREIGGGVEGVYMYMYG